MSAMKGKLIEILNCDAKWGIGKNNDLLFRLPKDMAFFRNTTRGHVVAMGENTLLSFPGSKPLKNRTNIVLSQDGSHNYDDVVNVHSMDAFKAEIRRQLENGDVFIVGGASIYRQMVPYADEVYLTKVHADGQAEVFYVNLDETDGYVLAKESEPEEDNGITITFCTYVNTKKLPL